MYNTRNWLVAMSRDLTAFLSSLMQKPPFFSLTAKAQRCIDCNSLDFADRDKNVDLSN